MSDRNNDDPFLEIKGIFRNRGNSNHVNGNGTYNGNSVTNDGNSQKNKRMKTRGTGTKICGPKSNKGKGKKFTGKGNKFIRKHKKGIAFAAAVTLFGAVAGNSNPQPTITVPDAVLIGETSESLGLDDGIVSNIQYVDNALKDNNIKNSEIIEIVKGTKDLASLILQKKFATLLGVDTGSIKFGIEDSDNEQKRYVESISRVYQKRFENSNNTSSDTNHILCEDVSNLIIEIEYLKNLENKVETGDFNRNKTINDIKASFDKINRFAAMKLISDRYENIISDKTTVHEFYEQLRKMKNINTSEESYLVEVENEINDGDGDTFILEEDDDAR